MKVAKLINNKYTMYLIHELFPNVSFPDVGVPESFLKDENLYEVIDFEKYDEKTQKYILLSEPILKNNLVYTFEILNKSDEEINNEKLQKFRTLRNQLLLESDIHVLSDKWESYTEEQKNIWKNYRQNLRDLPQTIQDLDNINWPLKPVTNNDQKIQNLTNIN